MNNSATHYSHFTYNGRTINTHRFTDTSHPADTRTGPNHSPYASRSTYSNHSAHALSPTLTALANAASASPSSEVYNPTLGFFIHSKYQQMAFRMMANPNLTNTCVLLWLILSSWANANFNEGQGFIANASAARLREQFGCADTTLRKSIKALTEEGYLISETDLGSFRRYYRLVPIAPKVVQQSNPTPCQKQQTPPPKMAGINIIRNLNKKITLTLPPKREEHSHAPLTAPSTPPPPQTDSSPVYITYEGNLLEPQDIPRPALPPLPEPPVVLGSLFNQQPTESDFEAMKSIMAKTNTLEAKGLLGKTLAHPDRENVLEPYQRLLCHLAGWAMQQKVLSATCPEPCKAYLIALKQDSCIPVAYRRWVKYGVHENDAAHTRYQQALEKAQGMATTKPPLPATVLVSLSHYWVNRIQTLIRNFKQPNPKTLLLEIAYHMVHFKPTQIGWTTEEDCLQVNFSLAIRLLKNQSWSTPKGLASLITRCQKMSGA